MSFSVSTFFSSKPKPRLDFIIDIQSSVVRGSLVLIHSDQPPHVIWTTTVLVPYRADGGSAYLVDTTIKAVETVSQGARVFIDDTHAHGPIPKHIARAHCVLSSPWIFSQARTVDQQFAKDTKITRAHVHNIIQEERVRLSQSSSDKMVGIEEKIFDVRLNGYSVSHWEGTTARSLEVSFAVSMASKSIIDRFSAVVTSSGARASRVDFHSSLLLQHIGMNAIMPVESNDSYVLIHVHGELTDIVAVDGQTCILFGSHPIGIRTIIRQISSELSLADSAVDSAITIYEGGQFDPAHASSDVQSIQRALALWTNNCRTVTDLIPRNHAPQRAVISSRIHEQLFKSSFMAVYATLKTDIMPTETILHMATFDPAIPLAEQLRLTVLYISAIHSLENL